MGTSTGKSLSFWETLERAPRPRPWGNRGHGLSVLPVIPGPTIAEIVYSWNDCITVFVFLGAGEQYMVRRDVVIELIFLPDCIDLDEAQSVHWLIVTLYNHAVKIKSE